MEHVLFPLLIRYEGGHAYGHFERTNHTYSMDVEQRCVWDYIGDNYVHRLIQNKADGKLVAVQDQGSATLLLIVIIGYKLHLIKNRHFFSHC